MKRELLSKAFGDIDDDFVLEAYRPVQKDTSSASEKIERMKEKRITLVLLAILLLALGIVVSRFQSCF